MTKLNRIFTRQLMAMLLILCSSATIARANRADAETSATTSATKQEQRIPEELINHMDSVEIGLLTCEPFHQIYALYGHTGLHYHDFATGEDLVANWGIFDMSKSFFAVRFAFGLTDYCMAIEMFDGFCKRYTAFRSGIREQILNLTNEEKARIFLAINKNYQPENRVYRYNFFYDNCTTRARDIIFNNLDGKVKYENEYSPLSYRDAIHQYTTGHEWMEWGQDFLLGVGADKEMTREQAQFLPRNLMNDFGNAVIVTADSTRRLVKTTVDPVPAQYKMAEPNPWTSPNAVVDAFGILAVILLIIERITKRKFWLLDLFTLLLVGIPGIILFCMIFSQHPTVSLNLQILVFNPLAIVFLWPIMKHCRKNERCWQMTVLFVCAFIATICGVFVQHFAMGNIILALILLLTVYSRRATFTFKKTKK